VTCSDFQTNLDLYLDAELDTVQMSTSALHVASCTTCNHVVTDYQKARALLITAVADRAAAVDVSGVWDEVSRRLDERKPNVTSLAAFRARRLFGPTHTRLRAAAIQTGAFAATAAAAALVFSVFTTPTPTPQAENTKAPMVAPAPFVAPSPFRTAATGMVAQSRPVRIDAMEIGAGHTVSTWMKPRTKTRVIWVASSGAPGYAVSDVSETR
jgi:hypothetical protein